MFVLRWQSKVLFKLCFMSGIGPHIDCNKCGQTVCAVVGTEIQTRYNIKTRFCGHNFVLVNWCVCGGLYLWRNDVVWSVVLVLIIISLLTSVFSYIKIYLKLHHQQRELYIQREQDHVHREQVKGGRIERYKKIVASIWWVQLAIVACYVPFIIVATLRIHGGIDGAGLQIVRRLVVTFTYFNSSLNPILYCWKIGEVRQVVKDVICKQLNCCKSAE